MGIGMHFGKKVFKFKFKFISPLNEQCNVTNMLQKKNYDRTLRGRTTVSHCIQQITVKTHYHQNAIG